jgi:hypothetical protein
MKITKKEMFIMLEKIRLEWYVIDELCRVLWMEIKAAKSLRPLELLLPIGKYKIDDGPWIKGSYYNYLKTCHKPGYYRKED